MVNWFVLTSLISLFLLALLFELLYLLRKISRKTQAMFYLFVIFVTGLTNGWAGLIVSLVISGVMLAFLEGKANPKSTQIDYGDGQEGTENLMGNG
jgi:hypothetical protein